MNASMVHPHSGHCPVCGQPGKPVKPITLESLLRPSARARMPAGTHWHFCANPDCVAVYFAGSDAPVFTKADLTVRVGIKEREAPRPVCYCFNHTIEEIEDEIRRTGRTTVQQDIQTRMKEACWCEIKSPLGSCCLPTVTRHIKAALEKYGRPALPTPGPRAEGCAAGANGEENPGTRPSDPSGVGPTGTATPGCRHQARSASGTHRAGTLPLIGGLLAAVLASACCWLPLLLLALGVSGVAVSATFEKYRPLFTTLTFILLAAAFYFAHRPLPREVGDAAEQEGVRGAVPAPGEACCPPADGRRRTFRSSRRVLLWLVMAAALLLVFLPNWIGPLVGRSSGAGFGPNVDSYIVAVQGMDCPACAAGLEAQLRAVPGVVAAKVNHQKQQAVIAVPKGVPPPREAILRVITRAGFTGHWPPG